MLKVTITNLIFALHERDYALIRAKVPEKVDTIRNPNQVPKFRSKWKLIPQPF